MTTLNKLRYNTERLVVAQWQSLTPLEWALQDQAQAAMDILTPAVTESLPPPWQGHYTLDRAKQWVIERNKEGTTLLAVDKTDQRAIGMIILFEGESAGHLRLGYMLKETAWGKGLASELIRGLVDCCRTNKFKSITGGVEHGNTASKRVLEKCGFLAQSNHTATNEQMFVLQLTRG